MEAKTKRRGIIGTAAILTASVLAILSQNPNDARLPDEAIVALYQVQEEVTADVFYGATVEEVRVEVEKRASEVKGTRVEMFAVPKEALQWVDFKTFWKGEFEKKGFQVSDAMIDAYMKEHNHPAGSMVLMWDENEVREKGELLSPQEEYDNARFLPKEPA